MPYSAGANQVICRLVSRILKLEKRWKEGFFGLFCHIPAIIFLTTPKSFDYIFLNMPNPEYHMTTKKLATANDFMF